MKTHVMYTWMYCRREYNIDLLLWCRGILQQNTFKSTYHQILQCKQSHIFWIWNIHQILMYNEEDTSKLRTVCIVDLIMCLNLLSVFLRSKLYFLIISIINGICANVLMHWLWLFFFYKYLTVQGIYLKKFNVGYSKFFAMLLPSYTARIGKENISFVKYWR